MDHVHHSMHSVEPDEMQPQPGQRSFTVFRECGCAFVCVVIWVWMKQYMCTISVLMSACVFMCALVCVCVCGEGLFCIYLPARLKRYMHINRYLHMYIWIYCTLLYKIPVINLSVHHFLPTLYTFAWPCIARCKHARV